MELFPDPAILTLPDFFVLSLFSPDVPWVSLRTLEISSPLGGILWSFSLPESAAFSLMIFPVGALWPKGGSAVTVERPLGPESLS